MKTKNSFGVYIKSLLALLLVYSSQNIYSQQGNELATLK